MKVTSPGKVVRPSSWGVERVEVTRRAHSWQAGPSIDVVGKPAFRACALRAD